MANHRAGKKSDAGGFEGKSSEKPVYIVSGPIATPVVGFSNDVTGTPPAPKMRMAPEPLGGGEQLPMGETLGKKNKSNSINPFGWKNPGSKK